MELTEKNKNNRDACGFVYVDSDSAIDDLTARIGASSWAGVDIEGSSLHSFNDSVSLIQICIEDGIYIVDPFCGIDVKALVDALSETDIIFHGGDYDLRMLLADFGFRPQRRIFDTMIGAELLGFEGIGLAAVLKELFGIEISKTGQKSNWTVRPLSASQLEYASIDVLHLKRMRDEIMRRLELLGREDWWRQCCERLIDRSGENKNDPDKEPWRIKGSRELDPSQLRYLWALWNWRNDIARDLNRPVFKVTGNEVLLNMAIWLDANPGKNPKKFSAFPKMCRGRYYDSMLEHIKIAKKLEKSKWPSHIIKRLKFWVEPDRDLLEQIKDCVNAKAETLGLKPQLLVTRAKLEAIARSMPKTTSQLAAIADLMDWQKELVAEDMLGVIAKFQNIESEI